MQEMELDRILEETEFVLKRAVNKNQQRFRGLDPEEIEQEVRIRIWKTMISGTEVKDWRAYIHRAVFNAAIDAIRKTKQRRETELFDLALESPDSHPIQHIHNQWTAECIYEGLRGLCKDRSFAVGLYLQGFSSPEIASLLGWTENKARNAAHRGILDLRAFLRKLLTCGS